MFGKCVPAMFFLNIGFAILFSGCYSYSALHQGQVQDGYSMALAFRHPRHEFVYSDFVQDHPGNIVASLAVRFGHAPSKKGEVGYSIGIIADVGSPTEVHVAPNTHTGVNDDMSSSSRFAFPRGSVYYQFPKNSFFDAGIGVEMPPLVPYLAFSRSLGSRFMLYGEVRATYGHTTDVVNLIVPTLGARFSLFRGLSFFCEMSLAPELLDCRYARDGSTLCEYRSALEAMPVMGIGFAFQFQ